MELIEIQAAIEALKAQLLAEAGTNLAEVGTATATLINLPPAQPEIVYCKDCRKHNVKIGFDENLHTVWKEDACPLVDWRGKAQGHEFDYQYCAYAERSE